MPESVDDYFVRRLHEWPASAPSGMVVDANRLLELFDAQAQSRHLDFAIRWLQSQGKAFYTIGSAGHESNAAVAMALRPTDPALLHYRSGGFYAARAAQVAGSTGIDDVLNSATTSTDDPISGGRHKVFGHRALNIVPQTSTIASHLPRAFGLAFALGRRTQDRWPRDSIVVCSFGDASANHSTATGAFNAAGYCAHQGVPVPLLLVCEDNGLGISTRSPVGWVERSMRSLPGIEYAAADGNRPEDLLATATDLVDRVRGRGRPAVLHLKTVRFMGHAGSDAEIAYRTQREITQEYERDPLLGVAAALIDGGVLSPAEVLSRYEAVRAAVMGRARSIGDVKRLDSAEDIMAPLTERRPAKVNHAASLAAPDRITVFGGRLPEDEGALTLAQTINAALRDALASRPQAFVLGEDVSRKGGVYGVTRGLRTTFGALRVVDTLLDEQTILGTALGAALAGYLPIPEIQYLAYLHNAEDQVRGEAATLRFFSAGQYENGMVIRIAGLAYQKGFGGHFHNDNSVAVLRDIPGLVVAVPSHPSGAAALLRQCLALAAEEGRVCVFLEPIALYHQRDLEDGDNAWLAPYESPERWQSTEIGATRTYGDGTGLLLVTFGNGVRMSLRAAARLEGRVDCSVMDLQWLSPLPVEELLMIADRSDRVLIVDETRRSGGVSESILTALVDGGYRGRIERVTSKDSFIPLGPAADKVLLSEDEIIAAALGSAPRRT